MLSDKPIRRSVRLKEYDYSLNGCYFVTICTYKRERLFGKIEDDGRGTACCARNEYGKIVYDQWVKTGESRNNVSPDEFIIMPDHIHGVIIINDRDEITNTSSTSGIARYAPTGREFGKMTSGSLSAIIRSFKSATTRCINILRGNAEFRWQQSFYDHIIRDDRSLQMVREYIKNNPVSWTGAEEDDYPEWGGGKLIFTRLFPSYDIIFLNCV